ncbi:hypothetical protein C7999DRAFT_18371 [Corynascus novoguineensis]|uniref:Uncharacterized protein n=1 Tax=Corynascus novoguineensis TaxID=1126955 RepID=A0AAN7CL34_9PEZI|nr:hypothetical protein C7999DRAFT_18371 [Corynascus novoguineensis]
MAADCQKGPIPLVAASAASPKRPRPNFPIPKFPSLSVSRTSLRSPSLPSPSNVGGAQRSDNNMPQNDVIDISSDDESDELDFGSLWARHWHNFKSNSSAGTGMA